MNDKLILEVIKKRKSVRTYSEKAIEVNEREILEKELKRLSNSGFRFEMIDYKFEDGGRIGIYGSIKGASNYIIGIMNVGLVTDKYSVVNFGYVFEQIVLKATELDLGTCWMVSTFNSENIKKLVDVKETEKIVIVSPVGYSSEKKRFAEAITRKAIKADKRKSWEELFFNNNFDTPLKRNDAKKFAVALDMIRIGPSGHNFQPWRIVKTRDSFDFYTVKTISSEKKKQKINTNYYDMGIAKLHFELASKVLGLEGRWIRKEEYLSEYEYVLSFVF